MNLICPKCRTSSPAGASFCHACGAILAATTQDGRTIAIFPGQPQPGSPPIGSGHTRAGLLPGAGTSVQRELSVLVNDVSPSMEEECDHGIDKHEAAKRAAIQFVLEKAQIDANDEVALVCFAEFGRIVHPLSPLATHRRTIIQTIQSFQIEPDTNINEGLKAADSALDWGRRNVTRRIVLLTDGQGGNPLRTAESLKSRGVVIDVIGVGPNPSQVDEKLLRHVASTVGGELRYRFIKDHKTLLGHYTQIAGKTLVAGALH